MSFTSVSCSPLLFILYGYLLAQFSLFFKSDYFVLRTCLSFICCYSLIFSIISMEWDLSFMGLGCMIWQGGRFFPRNSLQNVKSAPYYLCMGFDWRCFVALPLTFPDFILPETDFGLFFNILPHIFHPLPYFITFRNKLSTRHFELSTSNFKVIHNIEIVIHTFFRVIHMLSTNRRNSAFACLCASVSKMQHVSLNRMIYKRIIFIYIDLRYVSILVVMTP